MIRGGLRCIQALASTYPKLTVIETSCFMKAMKRKALTVLPDDQFAWTSASTDRGEPVDGLLLANVRKMKVFVGAQVRKGMRDWTRASMI